MILSSFIGFNEDLENEFKEFTIKVDPHTYFDKNEIKSIVEGNASIDYRFNCMILDSISQYVKLYLPKYLSVFANSSLTQANLYLGVNDWGEITGIPFKGNLTTPMIEEISKCLTLFIHNDNIEPNELLKLVNIKLHKLSIVADILDTQSLQTIVKDYHDHEKRYNSEYQDYYTKHTLWVEKIMLYSMSLQSFINDTSMRIRLAEYIESCDPANEIIATLKQNNYIELGDLSDIQEKKKDSTEMLYWLTKYKDLQVEELRNSKPSRPVRCTNHNVYEQQLLYLTNLRSILNSKLDYYVIVFELPTNLPNTKFRKLGSCDWLEKIRTIGFDGKPTSTTVKY